MASQTGTQTRCVHCTTSVCTGWVYTQRSTLEFCLPASCFHPVLLCGGRTLKLSLQSLWPGPAGRLPLLSAAPGRTRILLVRCHILEHRHLYTRLSVCLHVVAFYFSFCRASINKSIEFSSDFCLANSRGQKLLVRFL